MPMTEYAESGTAVDPVVDTPAKHVTEPPSEDGFVPSPMTQAVRAANNAPAFALLRVEHIAPSPTNPRKTFDAAKLQELADSIKASGVHQPVLVRPLPTARLAETFNDSRGAGRKALPTHELIAGERRLRACKLAGVAHIPAMIKPLTDHQVLEVQLVENLQRDDLSELEEAEGYRALIEATGIQKEAIGEKIGRSRGYVYGRLKLLDLSPTAREALREGKIDASRALLIARIPSDKLQLKALKEFTAEDYAGDTRLSFRAAKVWIQANVMLRLGDAKFDTADVFLVESAGACTNCPKRTGNDRDLFADVDAPDLCTDTGCFNGKQQAHVDGIIKSAMARGLEVIEGKEALEMKPQSWRRGIAGMSDLDGPPPNMARAKDGPTLRDVLSKGDLKGKVKLFIDPHTGEAIEVVPDALADKAREKLSTQTPPSALDLEDQRKAKLRMAEQAKFEAAKAFELRWRAPALEAIIGGLGCGMVAGFEPPLLRAMLLLMADNEMVDGDVIRAVLPLDPELAYPDEDDIEDAIAAIDDLELGATICKLLAHQEAGDVSRHKQEIGGREITPTPVLESLATTCQIDLQAIKRDAQAAMRAEKEPLPADDQDDDGDTAPAEEPGTLQVGARVRFLQDLKGPNGKTRKVSGREGTIDAKIGDRAWSVRFGKAKHETAIADGSELEVLVTAAVEGGAA